MTSLLPTDPRRVLACQVTGCAVRASSWSAAFEILLCARHAGTGLRGVELSYAGGRSVPRLVELDDAAVRRAVAEIAAEGPGGAHLLVLCNALEARFLTPAQRDAWPSIYPAEGWGPLAACHLEALGYEFDGWGRYRLVVFEQLSLIEETA